MPTDPLTGIPTDWVPLTQYQVPLNSNPVLSPEFQPQGRVGNVLYPDNIPTVFSTLQAYNNESPLNVQACSTDGNRNLNVNVAAGSLGGSSFPQEPNVAEQEDTGVHTDVTELLFPGGSGDMVDTSILLEWSVAIAMNSGATISGFELAASVGIGYKFNGSAFRYIASVPFVMSSATAITSQMYVMERSYPWGLKMDKFAPAITPGNKLSMYLKCPAANFDYYWYVQWIP